MSSTNIDWNDTIKKEAEGINGEDFGEVQDVSNGFVLVQEVLLTRKSFSYLKSWLKVMMEIL